MTSAARPSSPSIAVVGGGISGLTAAYRLRCELGDGPRITVYDPAEQLGGILRTITLGEHRVDIGAEAFITRRPEVLDLLDELGLADRRIDTTGARPLIYAGGSLHPLPARTVNGIPASGSSVVGLVDEETVVRIDSEPERDMHWTVGADPTVADLVSLRFGPQVVARLVDPLLGGVYAGSAATTGLRTAAPGIARALDEGASSLLVATRQALPPISATGIFGAIDGGYTVLVEELWRRARAEHRRLAVTGIARDGESWAVTGVGASEHADVVVVAVPAPRAADILDAVAPESAEAARAVPVASSVVVALTLPGDAPIPANSGVLVASGEALHTKALTFSTGKWGMRGRSTQVVRLSYGRFGDTVARATSDEQLLHWAVTDLETVLGASVTPIDTALARWIDAMPQYGPGHADVADAIRGGLPPGIAVAGSYLDGIGVPACVSSASRAAQDSVARWGHG
ncbi:MULTISPECIES: protoporphyrinogen oxidase [Mycobacteroides]|uniref:Coproporphyrinogen III oxidase n=1 Tax=Mycobacteroides chelonae TaxID=1774 RepID=A0A1S1LK06_MYCCH|nr:MULTISPECIES: protoporphyrinogen oxidase [Mycobacteroides]KRQ23130.1 protoporphyrinogen oxidase [Mycobacteroides sp. H003]KRQ33942.1 protoporphyrinogen oxidase [Mycobacteroides sp. H092]KRQ39866.1 protoporphyrinogen oxidase [Mycobacteroides sp. H101]KRQ46551.1 protoporphyrinogen oxidase [Mycobacteroides sp. H063]KRQ63588.1 protoporphyrinogen oxidase [Mycobacteroides sp. HXVII]